MFISLHLLWSYLRRTGGCCGLGEPGFETRLAESSVMARNECSLADFRARIKRLWVRDNFAGIFEGGQTPPDQFVEAKLLRSTNFDDAVYRRAHCDSSHRGRHIVGSHRLEKHRRQMHLLADHGNVGDPPNELKELRGMNDGVGAGGVFDQLLLSDLGPEVTTF